MKSSRTFLFLLAVVVVPGGILLLLPFASEVMKFVRAQLQPMRLIAGWPHRQFNQ